MFKYQEYSNTANLSSSKNFNAFALQQSTVTGDHRGRNGEKNRCAVTAELPERTIHCIITNNREFASFFFTLHGHPQHPCPATGNRAGMFNIELTQQAEPY